MRFPILEISVVRELCASNSLTLMLEIFFSALYIRFFYIYIVQPPKLKRFSRIPTHIKKSKNFQYQKLNNHNRASGYKLL